MPMRSPTTLAAIRLLTALLAALALAAPSTAQVLGREAALQALKSADAAQRERGVVGLAGNGRMADAPALVAALRDPAEPVRAAAEQALWIVWSRSGNAEVDKLFLRGLEEMNGGRFDDGIATFSRVIELAPDFAEGWNKRATLYFLAGDYRRSLADCDEVVKRNPAHFGALAGYGQIYLRLDDQERALEYFRRALAVNPNMTSVDIAARMIERSLAQRKKPI
jgi:tetratricopeptide (TPR) repeat protein